MYQRREIDRYRQNILRRFCSEMADDILSVNMRPTKKQYAKNAEKLLYY